ncbi:hypothetical protein DFJ74DRAFT_500064 [Hyaloraphidium curvatum]|nr:hypothetical protein DFJ74DRAFT_500064 [Hyaloraphidium curvatum]
MGSGYFSILTPLLAWNPPLPMPLVGRPARPGRPRRSIARCTPHARCSHPRGSDSLTRVSLRRKGSRPAACPAQASPTYDAFALPPTVAEPRSPCFPPEVLAHIAGFLKPGTRPLLEFSLGSHGVYELLAPRLYHTFLPGSDPTGGNIKKAVATWEKDDRFRHAKRLDFAPEETLYLEPTAHLHLFAAANFPALVSLDFCFNPSIEMEQVPVGWDLRFCLPALRELRYEGMFSEPIMKAFGPESCPALEIVRLELYDCEKDFTWSPWFLRKIVSIRCEHHGLIRVLAGNPSFVPSTVALMFENGEPDLNADEQTVGVVLRLPSVKRLEVGTLDAAILVDARPRASLDELSVRHLEVGPVSPQEAEVIRAVLGARRVELGELHRHPAAMLVPRARGAERVLGLVRFFEGLGRPSRMRRGTRSTGWN